jgi:glycine cleavage system H protein
MINAIDVLCSKSHEYAVKEDNKLIIGLTDYAVEQLGDIVFVELPEVGTTIEKGEIFGTIESVKAASELYMPVKGTVVEINEKLTTEPERINSDSYNEGWLIKVDSYSEKELDELMAYDEYKESVE